MKSWRVNLSQCLRWIKNKNKREIKNELPNILWEPLINLQTKVCEWGTLKYMNKVH